MKIKYDTPMDVTEKQYNRAIKHLSGVVAGNIENGKYYIKVWLMSYKNEVREVLCGNS